MDQKNDINNILKKLKKDSPKQINAFMNFVHTAKTDGPIDARTKELISIALAVSNQCEMCIAVHIKAALERGISKEEIIDASMQAVVQGGGPKLMYMAHVYNQLEKYA